jgi:hypothetical protein
MFWIAGSFSLISSYRQQWKKTFKNTEHISLLFARPPPHFKVGYFCLCFKACRSDISSLEPQPTILVNSFIFQGGDAAETLAPFRNGSAKPVADKVQVLPDMLGASHAGDAQILGGSRRMAIRGALITDSWPDLILDIWNRWCKFTEDDSVKQTLVLWDATKMDKVASVGPTDTAVHCRDKNHYYMFVNGR